MRYDESTGTHAIGLAKGVTLTYTDAAKDDPELMQLVCDVQQVGIDRIAGSRTRETIGEKIQRHEGQLAHIAAANLEFRGLFDRLFAEVDRRWYRLENWCWILVGAIGATLVCCGILEAMKVAQ